MINIKGSDSIWYVDAILLILKSLIEQFFPLLFN